MLPFSAGQPAHVNAFVALMAVGVIIGLFGHIYHSKSVILFGIFVVGAVSVYFTVYTLVPSS